MITHNHVGMDFRALYSLLSRAIDSILDSIVYFDPAHQGMLLMTSFSFIVKCFQKWIFGSKRKTYQLFDFWLILAHGSTLSIERL